jgi:hypothetical protein
MDQDLQKPGAQAMVHGLIGPWPLRENRGLLTRSLRSEGDLALLGAVPDDVPALAALVLLPGHACGTTAAPLRCWPGLGHR